MDIGRAATRSQPMPRVALVVLLVLAPATLAVAQETTEAVDDAALSRRSRAIERSTMSPFCPGKTIYDCPSPRAAEWRADIRGWLREGASATEIRERLQARDPDFDLGGSNPGTGGALAIFLGSALVMLLIAVVIWRRRRADPAPDGPPDADDDPELDARLEEELARVDRY